MKKSLLIILATIITISLVGCVDKSIPTNANISSENSSPSSIVESISSSELVSELSSEDLPPSSEVSSKPPAPVSSKEVPKPVESKAPEPPAPVISKETPQPESNTPVPLPASSSVVINEPVSSDTPIANEYSYQIYVTPTGKKYHYKNPCGRGTYTPATLEQALNRGLEPCGKCVL